MNRPRMLTTATAAALLLIAVPCSQARAAPVRHHEAPAPAPVTYRAIDLGTLGGSTSTAHAVNEPGDVVGTSTTASGDTHPFLWHDGHLTDLGTLPGGHNARAVDVNDNGLVVGESDTASGPRHAVAWHSGMIIDLGVLNGTDTRATGVNDSGQIVGDNSAGHAFRWHGTTMTRIGNFTPSTINNAGQVACWNRSAHAVCRWDGRTPTTLDTTVFSPVHDPVTGINAGGDVIGFGFPKDGPPLQAFLWHKGSRTTLTSLHPWESSMAAGINDQGEIVGNRMVGIPTSRHEPFLWRDGTASIPPGISTGAYLQDINDAHDIVGVVNNRAVLYRPADLLVQ